MTLIRCFLRGKCTLAIFLLIMCIVTNPVRSQTLDRGYGYDIDVGVIDPHNTSYDDMFSLAGHYLATLLTLGPDNTIQPGLAESWVHDVERNSLTLKLRDNLVWSDGTPLTAFTVKKSLERALSSDFVSDAKPLIEFLLDSQRTSSDVLLNNKALESDSWKLRTSLPNITVDDNSTLVIKNFPRSNANLIAFTHVLSAPLPLHQLNDSGDFDADTLMSSSGPYRLIRSDSPKQVNFVVNNKYYGEKPYFAFVNFYFGEYKDLAEKYFAFKLDLLEGVDIAQEEWLKNYYQNDLIIHPGTWADYLVLKDVDSIEQGSLVRQVLLSVLDSGVMQGLINDKPDLEIDGLIPWVNERYPKKELDVGYKMSLAEARVIMERAGYSEQNILNICIGVSKYRDLPKIDNYLKSQWMSVYIDAEIKPYTEEEVQQSFETIGGDNACTGVTYGYAARFKTEEEIVSIFLNDDIFGSYAISDPEFSVLYNDIEKTYQPEARLELVSKLEKKVLESYHAIRLNNYHEAILVKPYLDNYSVAKGTGSIAMSQLLSVKK